METLEKFLFIYSCIFEREYFVLSKMIVVSFYKNDFLFSTLINLILVYLQIKMTYVCQYCDGRYVSQAGKTRHLNNCPVLYRLPRHSMLNASTIGVLSKNIPAVTNNYHINYNLQHTNTYNQNTYYQLINQELKIQVEQDKKTFKSLESYIIGILESDNTKRYLSSLNKQQLLDFPQLLLEHVTKDKPEFKAPLKYIMGKEVELIVPDKCSIEDENKYLKIIDEESDKSRRNINDKIRSYVTVEEIDDVI